MRVTAYQLSSSPFRVAFRDQLAQGVFEGLHLLLFYLAARVFQGYSIDP